MPQSVSLLLIVFLHQGVKITSELIYQFMINHLIEPLGMNEVTFICFERVLMC